MDNLKKYLVEVTKSHQSEFPHPLKLKKDGQVNIGNKETNFEGWLWCTADSGNSGWVPENFVIRNGLLGKMKVDYDATELTVTVGQKLLVLSEESQWLWCIDNKDRKGWIPQENVRKL